MSRVWWMLAVAVTAHRAPKQESALAPRPRCARAHAQGCSIVYEGGKNYSFVVNGAAITYEFVNGDFFALKCPVGIELDEPTLPRFEPALTVREVRLECPPPTSSYVAALLALNVTSRGTDPGSEPNYVIQLDLNNVKNYDPKILASLLTLRSLKISDTKLTAADLALLPAGLERLQLERTGIGRVPAEVLTRLPSLGALEIVDMEPISVDVAGNLGLLSISTSATQVALTLPETLEILELYNWTPRRPKPWRSCSGLNVLLVYGTAAETLPDGWLARCSRLRMLEVDNAGNLRTIEAGALRGATTLSEVWFTSCALESLPAGLLDDARQLRTLHMSDNRLLTLPSDLFRHSESLSKIDLSGNNLIGSVLVSLQGVMSLSELDLGNNAALDACPLNTDNVIQGFSSLRDLRNLTYLRFAKTATQSICPDWRQLPLLTWLDLSDTAVTKLRDNDLLFNGTVDVGVDLSYTHLTRLSLGREDYQRANAGPGPVITVRMDGQSDIPCDCEIYWTVAALRHPNGRLHGYGALCQDGRMLEEVKLEELLCPVPGACPNGCVCSTRDDIESPGPLLRLGCAGAGLGQVPRVDAQAVLGYTGAEPIVLDLRLAGNRIEDISPEDLPPEVTIIDLRNNSLGRIDIATATVLVSRANRRVWLAGNPLDCGCHTAAAFAAMRANSSIIQDWGNATCTNGTALSALIALQECKKETEYTSGMSWLAMSAIALSVVVAALVVVALTLRRLRALRLRRHDDSGEWVYDAFISFAHADEAIVSEIIEQLEGGAAPLRLCVHYRDWMPGEWIPTQIAASVRVSRRTVAVVSTAFLRSKWARAEFREAYAAAVESDEPRLIIVLLEEPARLPLDPELRAYVTRNTYVRWGEPWFWQKLRRALPAPRPQKPSNTTEPAPASVSETVLVNGRTDSPVRCHLSLPSLSAHVQEVQASAVSLNSANLQCSSEYI